MAKSGASYIEAWRGIAENWFSALESVTPSSRSMEMFAVRIDDIHFIMLVDGTQALPDAEMVKALADGSLQRVRA